MKTMMRWVAGFVVMVAACMGQAKAQDFASYAGLANAYSFAYGSNPKVPALTVTSGSTSTGSYTVTLAYGYATTTGGVQFTAVSTNAPITIGGGTNMETVTPSAVNCTTPAVINTCTVTATFTYAHGNGDLVRSGDYGLQEAAIWVASRGGGLVAIDASFFKAAGLTTNAGLTTFLAGYNSLSTSVTIVNYGGISGALSYTAAVNSAYAATAYHLY